MTIADGVAIGISVLAFALSLFQFLFEKRRVRHEATINAFVELQKTVLNNPDFVNADAAQILTNHTTIQSGVIDKDWEEISEFLAHIEQFAVGVNTKVYSIKVVDRIAGSHLIKQYERFLPIIEYKRKKANTDKRYREFEIMAKKLKPFNPNI